MSIYANGLEVASTPNGGTGLFAMGQIQIGGNVALKQPRCWGGTIGPFVLSHRIWTPTEVAQWSADPSGFLRPAFQPIPYAIDALEFDTRTRRAVDFDARTRRPLEFDSRTRKAVDFDVRSRRAVDFDVRTRRAVDFDVRTRPKEN
jgi:hypothetical protein